MQQFDQYKQVYFIGIGGIGMSALARYFNQNGLTVGGYDKTPSPLTKLLEEEGCMIHFDDLGDQLPTQFSDKTTTLVVYTPAIKQLGELDYFKNGGFILLKRAEVLGMLTRQSKGLCVAGTHGKTTTSTMLGHILSEAGVNATSFLGGISENYNSNLILGGSEVSVVEADEFDRSFLKLSPNIACITSMDADHLDIYGEASELEKSFKDFGNKVSDTLIVRKGLPIEALTFGIDENARI